MIKAMLDYLKAFCLLVVIIAVLSGVGIGASLALNYILASAVLRAILCVVMLGFAVFVCKKVWIDGKDI